METPAEPDWEDLGLSDIPSPVYLAGPMTGYDDYNFPAFRRATAVLRSRGFKVVSPAELDEADTVAPGDRPWEWYMRRDVRALADCRSVAVLDGWRESRGASFEVHIARTLGMPVVAYDTMEPVDETVLEEAQRLIYGTRGDDYGHPIDDFTRTGRIWGAILGIDDIPPELVGLCMVGVKISRETNRPKRDNRVDGPGYFGCVQMIHDERRRRSVS